MRLVLQRGIGDCGIAAICTLAELSYEDVYIAAAKVDTQHRCKSGAQWTQLRQIAKAIGLTARLKRRPVLDEDEGLLAVQWLPTSKHYGGAFGWHLVALAHGVIADPADGMVLPPDEYLSRSHAAAGALLELT